MQARRNRRKQVTAGRETRRSWWLTGIGFGIGALLFGGVLMLSPTCLTPQQVAAQVLRGEKIGALTVTTETNLSGATVTATQLPATNILSTDTNKLGIPLAAVVTNATARVVSIAGDKYQMTSFRQLAGFPFQITTEILAVESDPLLATSKVLEQIPPEVKKLNERAVALTGFMLPVKFNEGLVTDFMLLPNTMGCCYGRMPRVNEIIIVNTTGKGFKHLKDIPITIAGTFHVGAIRNDGRLIGIYQMDCEQVIEAAALESP
jgi:hypothetical protein